MGRLIPLLLVVLWPCPGAPRELDRIERLLEELTNALGPSGFEGPVRAIVRREITPLATSVETDGLGSLIATLKGSSDGPRVMMAAHMDELGMLVKYITPEGYIRFQTLGAHRSERPPHVDWRGHQHEGRVAARRHQS